MDSEVVKRPGKFKLLDREAKGVEISLTEPKPSQEAYERSLVGRVFGGNAVNFTGLKQTMPNCGVLREI